MQAAAAIDVGSNATRMILACVTSGGLTVQHTCERYALRLGSDVFAHGSVSAAKQQALVEIFGDIARKLQAAQIRTYRAVATAALRDAQNGRAVCQSIFASSGLSLQIITGSQESKLMRQALLRAVGGAEADTLLLDLGGGSLELERAGEAGKRGRSLSLGSVRLLEMLPALRGSVEGGPLAEAQHQVAAILSQHIHAPRQAIWSVGTGGNLDILAKLLPIVGSRVPRVDLQGLPGLIKQLAPLSVEGRQKRFELRADRADLLLPAALIIHGVACHFGIKHLVVPGAGLRDALLYQLLVPADPGAPTRRLLGHGSDAAHTADRCYKLLRELFDDLSSAHRLQPPALHLLATALNAWYFGALLQPAAAAKHGLYIVETLDNLDLDKRGQQTVAWIMASLQQPASAPLPPFAGQAEDFAGARVLAGLLRIGIAMAPQGRRTSAIRVDLLQDAIVVEADLSAPLPTPLLAPLAEALGRRIVVR